MLRRAAGVISGKAISRFLSAIGRLDRSKFIAHPPRRAPARTARSNGIARSAAVTAEMPVDSMRALTGLIYLAIVIENAQSRQRHESGTRKRSIEVKPTKQNVSFVHLDRARARCSA